MCVPPVPRRVLVSPGGSLVPPLTIKLGHLLAELHLSQHRLELGLVQAGHEPSVDVPKGLPERGLQHLHPQGSMHGKQPPRPWIPPQLPLCSLFPNLLVEPEQGADHGDVGQGHTLSHQECLGAEVGIQHPQHPPHLLLGKLRRLHKEKKWDTQHWDPPLQTRTPPLQGSIPWELCWDEWERDQQPGLGSLLEHLRESG